MNAVQQSDQEQGSRFAAMLNHALPPEDHPRHECWRQAALLGVEAGKLVFDVINDYSAPHMRVLDVGCGNGGTAIAAALRGHHVTAVDIDGGSVARTLARAEAWGMRINGLQSDAASLPFPNDFFDLLVMNDLIEHVADPAEVLEEARRVLRPGGFAYIHAPQRWSPIGFLSDPHYGLLGVSVLPPSLGRWYVCRIRRAWRSYDVTTLPSIWGLRTSIARHGLIPVHYTEKYLAHKASAAAYSRRRGAQVLRLLARRPLALRLLSPLMPSVLFLAFKPANSATSMPAVVDSKREIAA